ncbi:hypothetical protein Mgra_00010065 [Meloidogyne graminicola]|uniref:Hint domain-containing protein n=1 Tax=Meloidogyne graminicola TaxID=189291 RepID=A0A8S9ZD37_9BILA|nr:hypothetical protein Mgra_00010065 [Meloidogyne graminicola]
MFFNISNTKLNKAVGGAIFSENNNNSFLQLENVYSTTIYQNNEKENNCLIPVVILKRRRRKNIKENNQQHSFLKIKNFYKSLPDLTTLPQYFSAFAEPLGSPLLQLIIEQLAKQCFGNTLNLELNKNITVDLYDFELESENKLWRDYSGFLVTDRYRYIIGLLNKGKIIQCYSDNEKIANLLLYSFIQLNNNLLNYSMFIRDIPSIVKINDNELPELYCQPPICNIFLTNSEQNNLFKNQKFECNNNLTLFNYCNKQNEWISEIKKEENNLKLKCCSIPNFSQFSAPLKKIILKKGEKYEGGPVFDNKNIIAFDLIKEIKINETKENNIFYILTIYRKNLKNYLIKPQKRIKNIKEEENNNNNNNIFIISSINSTKRNLENNNNEKENKINLLNNLKEKEYLNKEKRKKQQQKRIYIRKPLLSYYLRHLARIKKIKNKLNNSFQNNSIINQNNLNEKTFEGNIKINKLLNNNNNSRLNKFGGKKEGEIITTKNIPTFLNNKANKVFNSYLNNNSSSLSSQYNQISNDLGQIKKPRLYSDGSLIEKENLNNKLPIPIIKEEEILNKLIITPEEEEFQKIFEKEIEEYETKKEENNKVEKPPSIAGAAVITVEEEETTIIPNNENIEFEDEQNPFENNNYITILPTQNFLPSQEISYPIIGGNSFISPSNQQQVIERKDCSSSSPSCQYENTISECDSDGNNCILDNSPSSLNVKLSCGSCSCSVCQCSNLPDPCNGPNCGICPSICNCPEECGCNIRNDQNINYQQQYDQWYQQNGQQQYNQYYQGGGGGGGAFTTLQCFSGDQFVITPKGEIRMDKLKIGDMILSIEESLIAYSPVIMFLHRLPNEKAKFKIIETEEGNKLKLTEFHLVWAGCTKDLRKGECLYNIKNKKNNNNITNNNNIIQLPKEILRLASTKIKEIFEVEEIVSCHSNVAAQTLQQTFFRCWHFIYQLFDGRKNNLENEIKEFPEERELPFGVKFLTSILDILLPKAFLHT